MFRNSRKAGTKGYGLDHPAAVRPWQPGGWQLDLQRVLLGPVVGTSGFKVQASVGGGVSPEQCPLLRFWTWIPMWVIKLFLIFIAQGLAKVQRPWTTGLS